MRAILTYHSIDPSDSVISIDLETFRRQMRWLAGSGVRVVPLRDLPGAEGDAVALTFDDAFANFSEHALPAIDEHGFPATLFVVSEKVGSVNDWMLPPGGTPVPVLPLLDWSGVGRAAEHGVEIGAHGRRHLDCSSASSDEISDEISGSADDIARELGRRPKAFAYPYGSWSSDSAALVSGQYELSCTTELRTLGAEVEMHLLPRVDMYYFRRGKRLESFGTPSFTRYIDSRRIARSIRTSIVRRSRA